MLEPEKSDLPGFSLGMYFSINLCDDKVSADTAVQIARHAQQIPAMKSLPFYRISPWPPYRHPGGKMGRARPAGSAEHQAVTGDTPTLILAGEFDQNTPAFWGRLAGASLHNSHYIEIPGSGHGVIGMNPCVMGLMKAVYRRPLQTPARCLC